MELEVKLNGLGYNMLHREENEWAIHVLTFNTARFAIIDSPRGRGLGSCSSPKPLKLLF